MRYLTRRVVEFSHCDAAGIVFYPRYFELLNSVVEESCERALDWPFDRMHLEDRLGIPAVRIEVDFLSPAPLGDRLDFSLEVAQVGRSSATLAFAAHADGERRLAGSLVIVMMHLDRRAAVPWPDKVRELLVSDQLFDQREAPR